MIRLLMELLDLIMEITVTLSHIESVGNSPDQNLLLTAIVPKSFSDIKHNSVTKISYTLIQTTVTTIDVL